MYPKTYIDYFRNFNRQKEVFVAMPFSDDFTQRWEEIYIPGIKRTGLKPYRVDISVISNSILVDILAGIGQAEFILVDTSFQEINGLVSGPNQNVMYELGIAHSIRLPEEVIVIRDEKSKKNIPFDISHIRYTTFNHQRFDESITLISNLISDARRTVDRTKDLIVEKILRSLDLDQMCFMGIIGSLDHFDLYPFDPDRKGLYGVGYRDSSEAELRSIARELIGLDLLESGNPGPPEKRFYGTVPEYYVTALGKAVWKRFPDWSKQEWPRPSEKKKV